MFGRKKDKKNKDKRGAEPAEPLAESVAAAQGDGGSQSQDGRPAGAVEERKRIVYIGRELPTPGYRRLG